MLHKAGEDAAWRDFLVSLVSPIALLLSDRDARPHVRRHYDSLLSTAPPRVVDSSHDTFDRFAGFMKSYVSGVDN